MGRAVELPSSSCADGVRWDLGDLYAGPADPRLRDDLDAAMAEARGFEERYRSRVGALAAADFLEALRAYERILERGQRPAFFASLLLAADTQSAAALKLDEETRAAWTSIRSRLFFFELEFQAMSDADCARIEASAPLAPYRHYLRSTRRFRPHSLSEPEERILNQKALSSRSVATNLFDELTGSFRFEVVVDGERRALTDGEVLALLHHPERELRRRALESFLETYATNGLVLTSIFNAVLLDHRIDAELRRFPSPIAPRHLDNDVEPEIVEAMMAATVRHYPDVQEYFRRKARLLALPDLGVSDVYAPLPGDADEVSYREAAELVVESFAALGDRFAALVRGFFDHSWIDAEVRPGKRHGAFCAAHSPRHHPYVLTSYTGTPRDVSTLAHEIGHGIHALLASEQPLLVHDAPLVLAETASVFAEMLVTDHLLRSAPSEAARAPMLVAALDEIYGTIFRQNALTRFELAAHEARRRGRLDADDLAAIWLEAQRELFGDAVTIPAIYRFGWSTIPHFVHSPFYCYSYSFGNLLALALFERYREEGAAFAPRLLRLLESGGSERPSRILRSIGVELGDADFWESGLRAIGALIATLPGAAGDDTAPAPPAIDGAAGIAG